MNEHVLHEEITPTKDDLMVLTILLIVWNVWNVFSAFGLILSEKVTY